MSQRLQYRIDTAARFTSRNPLLRLNEIAWESDTGRQKIGNGTDKWADLDYTAMATYGDVSGKVSKAGDTMSGSLAMGGNKVTGLAAATGSGESVRYDEYSATATLATNALPKSGGTMTGDLVVGSGSSASRHITVDAAKDTANADLGFRASGSNRWTFRRTADTESGSNAGSHFALIRRNDDGSAISPNVFQIYRDTGKIMVGSVGATAGIELGSSGSRIMRGTGSPESAVTAPAGSIWIQTDHADLTYCKWVKLTGTGNTGWYPDFEGRWITANPTVSTWTLSNGTATGKYTQRLRLVTYKVKVTKQSSTTIASQITCTCPIDASSSDLVDCWADLSVAGNSYLAHVDKPSAGNFRIRPIDTSSGLVGSFTSSYPATWANGDYARASITYEI